MGLNGFGCAFDKLNTSRPFKAWWEDQLVNPFASCIWSLDEIIQIAEKQNFFCYSNSPVLPNPSIASMFSVNDIGASVASYPSTSSSLPRSKNDWKE